MGLSLPRSQACRNRGVGDWAWLPGVGWFRIGPLVPSHHGSSGFAGAHQLFFSASWMAVLGGDCVALAPRNRSSCIFTTTSTSLSLGRRQCGHRYAIRAGRNLPDKEFRYLRTVIVTAAVYRGFDQELAPHHLTFRHRAGVTPYTSTFVLAECCVFNKQSQPPILCDPPGLTEQVLNLRGHTFSRSYGINLPSSFSRVLSSA